MHVGIDLDDGGQNAKTETQRQHDARRACSRCADGPEGQAQAGAPRGQPAMRQPACKARAQPAQCSQHQECAADGRQTPGRQHGRRGQSDDGADKSARQHHEGEHYGPAWEQAGGLDVVAEELRRANTQDPGQRPEREQARGQNTVKGRFAQRPRVERELRGDRQVLRQNGAKPGNQPAAERHTDQHAQQREHADLHQVCPEHRAGGRAQCAQRADHGDLARHVSTHRRADAHAADRQRGDAHDRQERSEPVDEARHTWRGVAPVAPACTGFWECLGKCLAGRVQFGIILQAQSVARAEQDAGREHARGAQALDRGHHPWPHVKTARGRVRLVRD